MLSLALLFQGCALIPKPVEFFQKKVKSFPDATTKHVEIQKEVAQRAKQAAEETFVQSIKENSSPTLRLQARDAAVLTDAVSGSLGPPESPSAKPAPELAVSLGSQVAKHDNKVQAFAEANEKLEGKKVEGTGALSIPYFIYVGGIVLALVVFWHLAKTALTVASLANPGAAVGVAGMNVAGSLLSKGFHQLVSGGNAFKEWAKENFDPVVSAKITEAFDAAHKETQDQDVKTLVNKVNGK